MSQCLSSVHEHRNTTLLDNKEITSHTKTGFFLKSLETLEKPVYKNINFDEIIKIKKKLDACGKKPLFFHCACAFKIAYQSCNQYRVCPRCARKRYFQVRSQLLPGLINLMSGRGNAVSLKLLTLTQKNVKSVKLGKDRLLESFSRLKRTVYWKKNVYSYVMVIEPKLQSNGLWHVHAHLIIHSRFLRAHVISAAWETATGAFGSVIHVEQAGNLNGCINYLLKYITKQAAGTENQVLIQASLKGERLLFTGGQFNRNHKFCVLPEKTPYVCKSCGANYSFIFPCDFHLFPWINDFMQDYMPECDEEKVFIEQIPNFK